RRRVAEAAVAVAAPGHAEVAQREPREQRDVAMGEHEVRMREGQRSAGAREPASADRSRLNALRIAPAVTGIHRLPIEQLRISVVRERGGGDGGDESAENEA